MAKRFVYIPEYYPPYVRSIEVDFTYYNGFSLDQKQRCIQSLHEAFLQSAPNARILEISTKSMESLGIALSAFNLIIEAPHRTFSVESAFQSSKVFENGGPYTELLYVDSRTAKRDSRLRNSGNVIGFRFGGRDYPTEPKDLFYNWLYINALFRQEQLAAEVCAFDAFTDIEFNPSRSINCQAIAAAVYVGLVSAGKLEEALSTFQSFESLVYKAHSSCENVASGTQLMLDFE